MKLPQRAFLTSPHSLFHIFLTAESICLYITAHSKDRHRQLVTKFGCKRSYPVLLYKGERTWVSTCNFVSFVVIALCVCACVWGACLTV